MTRYVITTEETIRRSTTWVLESADSPETWEQIQLEDLYEIGATEGATEEELLGFIVVTVEADENGS
jgi:hypothetical protein